MIYGVIAFFEWLVGHAILRLWGFQLMGYVRSVALSTKFVCFYKYTNQIHQELWDNPKQNWPKKLKAGRNWIVP